MTVTNTDIYEYVNNDFLADVHKHLKGLTQEQLDSAVSVMSDKTRESLTIATKVYKVNRRVKTPMPKFIVESVPPPTMPISSGYHNGIFLDGAKKEDYSEENWNIRLKFLEDLSSQGSDCSSCSRAALTRKYAKLLV